MKYKIIKISTGQIITGVNPSELFSHIPPRSKCRPIVVRDKRTKLVINAFDESSFPGGEIIQIHPEN